MTLGKARGLLDERIKGALKSEAAQLHLVLARFFDPLIADVAPSHGFVQPNRGGRIAGGSKMLSTENAAPTAELPGNLDRALAWR